MTARAEVSAKPVRPFVLRRPRARTQVLVLLCLMYAISYIDRANISTAAPSIQQDLGLTDTQLGVALAAFSVPYALLSIFGGVIGAKIGPRWALTLIGLLWGVATIATGFSIGLVSLIGARLLLGLSESGAFPVATQVMSRWMPTKRYGFAQGIVHSSSRLGNALAPLAVAAADRLGRLAGVVLRDRRAQPALGGAVVLAVPEPAGELPRHHAAGARRAARRRRRSSPRGRRCRGAACSARWPRSSSSTSATAGRSGCSSPGCRPSSARASGWRCRASRSSPRSSSAPA